MWDGNTIAQEITLKPKGKKDADEQQVDITHWYFIPHSFTPLAQQIQSNSASDKLKENTLYTSYIATDHMGTVKELFSPEGDLVWKNKNSLWGKPKGQLENANRTPEVECSLGFQGQYFDKETELHYNFHRYYDAEMGQYISPDPIGLLGGLNPQAYVHNPNGWVDPFGLETILTSGTVYRSGSAKPSALTPAAKDLPGGLSTFNNTDIMMKKLPSTKKAQILDISKLGSDLEAVLDGDDGHVSIRPKNDLDGKKMKAWSKLKGTDLPNPLADQVRKSITGEWKPCKKS